MKKKSKLLCTLLSVAMCALMIPAQAVSAITVETMNSGTKNSSSDQIKGTENGYSYELWNQDNKGNASMTLGSGGTYSCEWSNIYNVLARRGMDFDCTKTYQELGNITVDYDADFNIQGNCYLCVYGWTRDPLVEYYIVENWGEWRPPGNGYVDTVTIGGDQYDVYKTERVNQPSIDGNTTFWQYWSVRVNGTQRSKGVIDVAAHFAAWESLGLNMGKLYEVALNAEGFGGDAGNSSAKVNVKKNEVTVGGEIIPTEPPTDPEPDENGYFFHSTYEEGADSWVSRGDASVKTTADRAYKGSKSLSVTGRTDTWNGTARSLNTAVFVPGKAYSFSAMAMQELTASEDFKLTLQCTIDGEETYHTVAEASGAKGQWVQLANTSFTIPAGASNLLLYIETADSTTSFYVDEAIGAPEGTVIGEGGGSLMGDIVADGVLNDLDVAALQNYLLCRNYDGDISRADVNGDGIVNVFDLVLLKRLAKAEPPEKETEPPTETTPPQPSLGGTDISWIDPSKPMVAISFDDGAVGTSQDSTSMRILNALHDSGFQATFFYVGNWIGNNQAEVTTAYNMGMEIANHTTSHPNLTEKSPADIRSEYDNCFQTLQSIIGTEPSRLMRLPYLASNSTVESTLNDVPLISCALDTQDWNGASKDDIIRTVTNAMQNGTLNNSIVLAHETYASTAEAMEYLCPYLKSQGWQIVTISQLYAVNGVELQGGQIHRACK